MRRHVNYYALVCNELQNLVINILPIFCLFPSSMTTCHGSEQCFYTTTAIGTKHIQSLAGTAGIYK